MNAVQELLAELGEEILRAEAKHPPMNSPHEGHSVIREELDELWEHVRADTGRSAEARKEAIQIAAMGLRYALNLCAQARTEPDIEVCPSCGRSDEHAAPCKSWAILPGHLQLRP